MLHEPVADPVGHAERTAATEEEENQTHASSSTRSSNNSTDNDSTRSTSSSSYYGSSSSGGQGLDSPRPAQLEGHRVQAQTVVTEAPHPKPAPSDALEAMGRAREARQHLGDAQQVRGEARPERISQPPQGTKHRAAEDKVEQRLVLSATQATELVHGQSVEARKPTGGRALTQR